MSEAAVKGQRVRLKKDYVTLIRRSVERAVQRTIEQIVFWTIGPQSPVPVRFGDLRQSLDAREKQSPKGFATGVTLRWTAPYAEILVQRGLAGTAQARAPGTTLLYPQAVKSVLNRMFIDNLHDSLCEEGLK